MMKAATFVLMGLMLASCSTIRPDGVMDNVVSGDLMGGGSEAPTTDARELPREPDRGPVRWRIDF
jgi:hypothetical protein